MAQPISVQKGNQMTCRKAQMFAKTQMSKAGPVLTVGLMESGFREKRALLRRKSHTSPPI